MRSDNTITIDANGRSVIVTDEQISQAAAEQMPLPFPANKDHLAEFLYQVLAIEDEMDRLREVMHDLVKTYKDVLPLRAVRTAIKVVRARKKLAEHHKESCTYANQVLIENFVAEHIACLESATQEAAAEAEASAQRPAVPDLTGGAA